MKPPPTDPPPSRPSAPDDATASQAPPARRPGLHTSYRLAETHSTVQADEIGDVQGDEYDDGVPRHRPGEIDELHNEGTEHEHTDVNIRALIWSAVMLVIVGTVSASLMYLLFGWFEQRAAASDPSVSPLAVPAAQVPENTAQTPYFSSGVGGPRLLTNEPMALEKQRAEEQKRLQGYGWVNQAGGVAHIPIDEAKKLIRERGLPTREGEPVTPALGTRLPALGESSGGRVITMTPPAGPATPTAEQPPGEHGQGQQPTTAKPHGPGGL